MDELIQLILSTGTKVVIIEETVIGGVMKRPLTSNYVLPASGTVTEVIEYANDAQSHAWGAIKFTNYTLTSANDMEILAVQKERRNGNNVIDDLLIGLKSANATDDQKATLFKYVIPVIVLLLSGDLRAAKAMADNLAVSNADFYTNARKTWLMDRLQEEIDKP